MSSVRELHRKAMSLGLDAERVRGLGQPEEALEMTRQAFELELAAANLVPTGPDAEPTRSILFASAASLAFQTALYDDAIRLIGTALAGNPPPKVQDNLLRLLDEVKFHKFADGAEKELGEGRLLLTLRGKAVGVGLILYDEFKDRYESTVKLINKTTERLTQRPYRRGPDKDAFTFEKLIEVPSSQSSFAITVRLMAPKQPSLLIPDPNVVIDEVVYGIDLVGNGREEELRTHINDEQYYAHFVNLVKSIAPDGNDVAHVGLTSSRRSASLARPRSSIEPPTKIQAVEVVAAPIRQDVTVVDGVLKLVDDKFSSDDSFVGIVADNGQKFTINPDAGVDELVDQYWGRRVRISGRYDGAILVATDIEPIDDN